MFVTDHTVTAGVPEQLAPGLVAVTAPNPGPMTFTGTRTYLLAGLVIDPGPNDPAHRAAVLAALEGPVEAVLVTHPHRDHSAGARALAEAVGAPLLGPGAPAPPDPALGGGEGRDAHWAPDRVLGEGEPVGQLRAVHLPGHMDAHLGYAWEDALFTGDVLMAWSTTLISPPDGDLAGFRTSLDKIEAMAPAVAYPGHGPALDDPAGMARHQRTHRAAREAQVIAALPGTAEDLVKQIYPDLAPALRPAAARNVLAHLLDLGARGVAGSDGPPVTARWHMR